MDYGKLNAVTKKDVYPLPIISEDLSRLSGASFFTELDFQSGYWQVPVKEKDRPKTAFIAADGLYQFKVIAFGLTSATSGFHRLVDVVLAGLKWTTCLSYLDDICIYSKDIDEPCLF